MNLSIIIPAYNEENRIKRTLESYGNFFKNLKNKKEIGDFEISVVLNACTDGTEEVVKKLRRDYNEINCTNLDRKGKGLAIINGFNGALKGNWHLIGFADADMSTSPDVFYELAKNIKGYGGVIASRYLKGSVASPRQSFRRIIASRVFNFLVRAMFNLPYRDTQLGAKLFTEEAIKKVLPKLGTTDWAFDVDLLYNTKRLGFKIKEIPTLWKDSKESKLKLGKVSAQMLLSILRLRLLKSRFRRVLKVIAPLTGRMWRLLK